MSIQVLESLNTSENKGHNDDAIVVVRETKSEPAVTKLVDLLGANPSNESVPENNSDISLVFEPSSTTPVFHGFYFYKDREFYSLVEELESKPEYSADLERIRESHKRQQNLEAGQEFDPRRIHPACFGYQLLTETIPNTQSFFEKIQSPKTCPAKEYVETYVFPILLPAMEKMLQEAKVQEAFVKRRTRFNGCDYLTEYLYRHNSGYSDRSDTHLYDIPFVQRILKEHFTNFRMLMPFREVLVPATSATLIPRPPLPLSLLITEEEAAEMIQSFWRGYKVRKDPEVQELRKYQREMREEEYDINFRVSEFWKKHPVEEADEDSHEAVDDIQSMQEIKVTPSISIQN